MQKTHMQKEEIIRTIKMQENIGKLNEFCKKKLEKQQVKKRNATMQSNPLLPDKTDVLTTEKDISRMSAKRLIFDNVKKSLPNGFNAQDLQNKKQFDNQVNEGSDL